MSTSTLRIYSNIKSNLGSIELEIYDVAAGVRSHSTWFTEIVTGDFASLSQRLQSQGYHCREAVFIKA
jgi:trans-2-enoyl-CoA reductase